MREVIENYYKRMQEYPHYYKNESWEGICTKIKSEFEKGIFFVQREDITNISVFQEKYGYTLPDEIEEYINLFWHPAISGYLDETECIVLFAVVKKEGDSANEILYYKNGLMYMAREWEKIGDIKRFVPIGWLGYSGGFVLYEVSTGKIYLEDMDADSEGQIKEPCVAKSLRELVSSLKIA